MGLTSIGILKSYIYGFISGILCCLESLGIKITDLIAIAGAIIISIVICYMAEGIIKLLFKLLRRILT